MPSRPHVRTPLKTLTRLFVVATASAALVGVAATPTATAAPKAARPTSIALPAGFQPEGIAIGRAPVAYLGSRATGDIYAADLRTGRGRVISKGSGTPSLGLKVDRSQRRLYVSGGTGRDGRVIDIRTGKVVRSWTFTTGPAFVNDVVLTRHGAWFSDSNNAQLYRVTTDRRGKPKPGFRTLPLRGDWVQGTGISANGLVQTPDKRALLVVNSGNGLLYRVNTRTGVAKQVDLGGYPLTNGDGMLREGRTLYVVQNRLNKVAVLKLNRAGTQGRYVRAITDARFDVPTTVASYRGGLYLPNARFSTTPTPTTAYAIIRVPRG